MEQRRRRDADTEEDSAVKTLSLQIIGDRICGHFNLIISGRGMTFEIPAMFGHEDAPG